MTATQSSPSAAAALAAARCSGSGHQPMSEVDLNSKAYTPPKEDPDPGRFSFTLTAISATLDRRHCATDVERKMLGLMQYD